MQSSLTSHIPNTVFEIQLALQYILHIFHLKLIIGAGYRTGGEVSEDKVGTASEPSKPLLT